MSAGAEFGSIRNLYKIVINYRQIMYRKDKINVVRRYIQGKKIKELDQLEIDLERLYESSGTLEGLTNVGLSLDKSSLEQALAEVRVQKRELGPSLTERYKPIIQKIGSAIKSATITTSVIGSVLLFSWIGAKADFKLNNTEAINKNQSSESRLRYTPPSKSLGRIINGEGQDYNIVRDNNQNLFVLENNNLRLVENGCFVLEEKITEEVPVWMASSCSYETESNGNVYSWEFDENKGCMDKLEQFLQKGINDKTQLSLRLCYW